MDEDNVPLDLSISRKEPSNSIEAPLPDVLPNQEDHKKIESVDPANFDISQSLHSEIVTERKQINPEDEAGQGKKRFACPQCRKSFGQKGNLKRHLMIHTDEKQYKCEICGVAFRHRKTLNDHVNIHTDEKPYKCKFCGVAFRQRPHLNTHLQIHTGEKPHKCEICGAAFHAPSNLRDHVSLHTGIWRYTCKICGYRCNYPSHLKRHSKTHTDLESNSTLTNNSGNESPKAGPSGCSSK